MLETHWLAEEVHRSSSEESEPNPHEIAARKFLGQLRLGGSEEYPARIAGYMRGQLKLAGLGLSDIGTNEDEVAELIKTGHEDFVERCRRKGGTTEQIHKYIEMIS